MLVSQDEDAILLHFKLDLHNLIVPWHDLLLPWP